MLKLLLPFALAGLSAAAPAQCDLANTEATYEGPNALQRVLQDVVNSGDFSTAVRLLCTGQLDLDDPQTAQTASWLLAMAGREIEAEATFDRSMPRAGFVIDEEVAYVPAIDEIARRAADHRLTIINEGHHIARNRWFALALARRLFDQGYEILTVEALNNFDDSNQFHGPVLHSSGILTNAPALATLINEFISLGGRVYPHERTLAQQRQGVDRELAQAENVLGIIRENPDAKILSLVGFDHVSEAPHLFAGRLTAISGLDVLSVDQVAGMPRGENSYSEMQPHLPSQQQIFQQAMIPIDISGNPVVVGTDRIVDLVVVHPPSTARHGRPAWLATEYGLQFVEPPTLNEVYSLPAVIEARPLGTGSNEVPSDRIYQDSSSLPWLALPRGEYTITFATPEGVFEAPTSLIVQQVITKQSQSPLPTTIPPRRTGVSGHQIFQEESGASAGTRIRDLRRDRPVKHQ